MRHHILLAVAATFALSACGGGGSSSPTPSGGGTTQTQAEVAVSTADGAGSQVSALSAYERDLSSPLTTGTASSARAVASLGTCTNSMEFFAPDKNGDPNSTETQYFYDAACTELARDVVRVYTSTGASSETVARTVNQYALGNATPSATRTDSVTTPSPCAWRSASRCPVRTGSPSARRSPTKRRSRCRRGPRLGRVPYMPRRRNTGSRWSSDRRSYPARRTPWSSCTCRARRTARAELAVLGGEGR